eukprot:tig00020912_g15801.t1
MAFSVALALPAARAGPAASTDEDQTPVTHSSSETIISRSLAALASLASVLLLPSAALAADAGADGSAAKLAITILGPALNIYIVLFIVRIVLTWYPQVNLGKLPWVLAVRPTEPILRPTRKVIQPVGGVDISPIVWVAILSFLNEIMFGPQGILTLLAK